MTSASVPAAASQPTPQQLVLSGCWTAQLIGKLPRALDSLESPQGQAVAIDATAVQAMDTTGAWLLQKLVDRFRSQGAETSVQGLVWNFSNLLQAAQQRSQSLEGLSPKPHQKLSGTLATIGHSTINAVRQANALLAFVGETALTFGTCIRHPGRFRWRPVLFNLRTAGVNALPIVGLLSFLLGVVVAYQGAAQLRLYGANIFVADLVGLSMLREFAPLIAAIIIAGRSGSAYTAQIGTMAVTEEIDALRTIGIEPLELLVLPKVIALMVALPLLTVFADFLGVAGGMIMARSQLGVSFNEFLDRFVLAVSPTAFLVGICKAPVFAAIIAMVGCYQGFQTKGGADSVGRQTTRSVVQSIFLVIVTDAAFSVVFSALDL